MNVGELKAALDEWPDDTELAVIDDMHDDLETDVSIAPAVNHPGSRPRGRRSWHWEDETAIKTPGIPVLVFH